MSSWNYYAEKYQNKVVNEKKTTEQWSQEDSA